MSYWRVLGELPQRLSREELEEQVVQSLGGWNPFREMWVRVREPDIVVPDPTDTSRYCHVHTYEAPNGLGFTKFAAGILSDDLFHFWVPAPVSMESAIEARQARFEGYWRGHEAEVNDLPWPTSEPGWESRSAFLDRLDVIEREAERIAYRGFSQCRLCGRKNGHEGLRMAEWEWPEGYRHYLTDHDVRPTQHFEAFVFGWNKGARSR